MDGGSEEQHSEAFALFLKLADAGHINSTAMVGSCYEEGCGVKQDMKKAVEFYRKAAEHGQAAAGYLQFLFSHFP